MKEQVSTLENPYEKSIHRIGRISCVIAISFMVGIPIVLGIYYKCMPPLSLIVSSGSGLFFTFLPVTISEVLSYAPLLGSGSYITFITGNVTNLKIPVAINALSIAQEEQATEKGDAIVTIGVCASSIITMLVIFIGVILLVPLHPLLTSTIVTKATKYMVPALLGSLVISSFVSRGKTVIKGRIYSIIPAVLILIILIFCKVKVSSYQGFAIIGLIPVTILTSKLLYDKGIIKVEENKKQEKNK
ncbi:MAG: hypothetical protein LBR30_03650 [Clostridioides sp.]|nr:hypothetical protein [Clostridioides sp.]